MAAKTKSRKRTGKSTTQASKPRTPKEEAAQKPINGVLVQLVPTEGSGAALNLQALGSVTVNELPTILGLARKAAEGELGI